MTASWLRGFAIVLALAAALDPAITSTRMTKPQVAVVAEDSLADGGLADRVVRDLSKTLTVVRAPFVGAAATVVVGSRLPVLVDQLAAPVFAILPERVGPTVTLEAVHAPARTPFEARVPITAVTRVTGAAGRTLEVELLVGDVVVDHVERSSAAAEELLRVPLAFVPTATGIVPLRVTAQVANARRSAADLIVDVREKRWAVLFFDRRPSWMSTFVRRALEHDPRFVVTSRVVTSRNISTAAGRPPAALDDLASLELFDAIVVGAPETLNDRDVTGLDSYLRRRAGGAILLFDRRAGGAYERLTEVAEWANASGGRTVTVAAPKEQGRLRASELIWPARLPAGAQALALDSAHRPLIWRSAVGAGQLIVSGALDSWKFRDRATSAFDEFWQSLIAETAAAGAPPVDVSVSQSVLEPGESTDVIVTLRDAALSDMSSGRAVHAAVSATLEGNDQRTQLRLWPDGPIGRLRGSFRAPSGPGTYRVVASANGNRAEVAIAVTTGVHRLKPDQRDLLGAWASSRGGSALPASHVQELPAALARALQPRLRPETWHPMRSGWWILPFVLALGAEWWWRRRRGLA